MITKKKKKALVSATSSIISWEPLKLSVLFFLSNFCCFFLKRTFFWLCWASVAGRAERGRLSLCGEWACRCDVFSSYWARALGCADFSSGGAWPRWLQLWTRGCVGLVVAVARLWSTGSALWCLGLVAPEVFLDQGSNTCLLHRQVDSSPLSHYGSPQNSALPWCFLMPLAANSPPLWCSSGCDPIYMPTLDTVVLPMSWMCVCVSKECS